MASPYASFILDWNGRILVCNRRAERSFAPATQPGCGTLNGTCISKLTTLETERVVERLRDGTAKGAMTLPMTAGIRTAASPDTEFRVSLLRSNAQGERLILLTHDQLRVAADSLRQMNELRSKLNSELHGAKNANLKLQETLLSMEAFAHAASHDLRTPISTLSGSLHYFWEHYAGDLPETARDFLQHMTRATRQMDRLTTELLDHSVSTSARINVQEIAARDAVSEACTSLSQELQACGGKIRVNGDGFRMHADPTLLHLVLTNLLSNAIKYRHPDRSLQITIDLSGAGRDRWNLSVADNGTGFDPEDRHMILQPFRRAHREIEGSGIGLSTCAEICRRHNWLLTADAEPGKGAVFTISFG
ncbi:HAMP domain-containing histidine kinase [Leisingera sp. S132]|uniref:sensor histidine kinase n=1 Tax=Leisingera sp. S132 TaxID=2867016 RepID=UPI0021A46D2E|nr:HAMP domain-containing sensor histidine kinase [Leisingera sp. S132]UWQ79428.1 HAMP domain-containing histidine kinase [Leisingera sp. S132]